YDVLGRLVLHEKEQFNTIDVSQLNSGLLFVKIETKQGSVTKKVVKN
ncbi:MAG: T9SS type A sorting domain-containing protein, partial [Flavobacteriaceae bacterium]|nr:T9SS type A sorting domain-containing protein [Flavobacteriaceae bacterium]